MIFRILIVIALILAIDLYAFQAFRFVFRNDSIATQKTVLIVFWSVTALCILFVIAAGITNFEGWPKSIKTFGSALIFILIISKLLLVVFLLTDDIFRGLQWAYKKVFSGNSLSQEGTKSNDFSISRSEFLVKGGMLMAMVPFISLIYGMVKGAYDYQIKKVKIKVAGLPESFHGFRIAQISDIHTGSFVNSEPLKEAVKLINDLEADVILFTGDLVNNRSDELDQHKETLMGLTAVHGIYSILGNHDYGDYVQWDSEEAKTENLHRLIRSHKEMGWDILLDEHRLITRNGESITLIGVQNWSAHLRFPKYGSMSKATKDISYSNFNILMSHDPSHWKAEILEKYPEVHLMLAGHTHGMQFGVELPFMKWSPVQYIYKEWAGLYEKGHQKLYVNRGLGFLGYPGRVGILPEITIIELAKG